MSRLPLIIDTDPGLGEPGSDIDDGLAIALALASPEIELLGLTVVNGNVDLSTGIHVARRLIDRLGRPDLPVLGGAEAPLRRRMQPIRELFAAVGFHHPQVGQEAGTLGPTSPVPTAEWLVEQVRNRPGEITIVAIGPMTNIATAIRLDPGFARDVGELVLMAGSATGYAQNVTVVGDFNAYVDPEALDIVIRSGAKVRMVGLDQTSRVMLTRDDAGMLRARDHGDGVGRWIADCTDAWIDFLAAAFPLRPEHQTACFLHDPLVLAAVIRPELCTWAEAHVQVELESELARGLVVADRGLSLTPPGPTNATVATDTDVAAFRSFFLDRMAALSAITN